MLQNRVDLGFVLYVEANPSALGSLAQERMKLGIFASVAERENGIPGSEGGPWRTIEQADTDYPS